MIPTPLQTLYRQIQDATDSPLAVTSPMLIAASKSQPAAAIEAKIQEGIQIFGENRVQEAQTKWPDLKARYPHIALHLIGGLQRNKATAAVALFDAIHTLDRIELAESLAEAMDKQQRRPACFIQVNTGDEPQKSGVAIRDAERLIDHARHTLRLPVSGLMCVPPADQPPAPHFALLRAMALDHGLPHLSMGMSDDFITAIRLGATHIRLGRIVFGERLA